MQQLLMGPYIINSIIGFQKINRLSNFPFWKAALDYWWEKLAFFVKQMKQRQHEVMSQTLLTKPLHKLHISHILVTTMQ